MAEETPKAWRLPGSAADHAVERAHDGKWVLVVEQFLCNRWELDISAVIVAAAVHHSGEEVATLKSRIRELEEELERVTGWVEDVLEGR